MNFNTNSKIHGTVNDLVMVVIKEILYRLKYTRNFSQLCMQTLKLIPWKSDMRYARFLTPFLFGSVAT